MRELLVPDFLCEPVVPALREGASPNTLQLTVRASQTFATVPGVEGAPPGVSIQRP